MRNVKWLVAATLVASTAGCVQTMDSGYAPSSYGYGSGYADNGYYSQPSYYQPAPSYYYQPAPQVVTQTRYVPVPVPVATPAPHRTADRWVDRQSHGNPPPAATNPTPQQQPASNGQQQTNRRRGSGQDRDGDGRPDAPRSDRRS